MAAHSSDTTAGTTAGTDRRSGKATTAMILGIVSIPAALIAIVCSASST
jgi:hypothetical protein